MPKLPPPSANIKTPIYSAKSKPSANAIKSVGTVTKTTGGPSVNSLRSKFGDFGATSKQRVAIGQAQDRKAGRAQRPS